MAEFADTENAYAFWRSRPPGLAVALVERFQNGRSATRIELIEYGSGSSRVVTPRGPEHDVRYSAPRWNPRRDELMYLVEDRSGLQVAVYGLSTGSQHTIPLSIEDATWHPDGDRIVYVPPRVPLGGLSKTPPPGLRPALQIAGRDGTNERVLMATNQQTTHILGIATVSY